MVNGKMPAQQEAYNNFMSSWVPPIQESIHGVEGGGYMYGGMQPGLWNDGAHGVITINPSTGKQYVHVVTRPRADFVRLRDNGYKVSRVTDLRTGERLKFSQSAGHLTIEGITAWDEYDTVFAVETQGQQGFYDGVKASATSSRDGFPASNLTDGSYEKYWDANAAQPVSISLDLGRRKEASFLAINQRESSPTHARVSFGRPEDSSRIKDYQLTASDDGRNWWHVRTGALPSARGTQFIDIGSVQARWLRLTVLNTWSGPQAPVYFKELKIDEIRVGHSYPRSASGGALEAEDAGRSGSARAEFCAACSGTRQVTGLGGGERNAVTYRDVSVAAAGTYALRLDLTSASASSVSVSVNGAAPVSVAVPADRADVPAPTSLAVPLNAGRNTIRVLGTGKSLGLDRISVGGLPPSSYTPKTTLTVEPHGLQWVAPGQQSVKITARLRLDADDQIDNVSLAPALPAGWTLTGSPATRSSMRLGGVLEGVWTAVSPAGQDVGSVSIPVTASFQLLSSDRKVSGSVPVRTRPADRVFVREAEDSANVFGSTGLTSCGTCSGGEKVRNIGGSPDATVTFPNITVPAGTYRLFITFTVNGPRSYFVSVNGGAPVEVKLDGVGNNTPYTAEIPVTLNGTPNTIKFGNDQAGAPDLDQIAIG